MDVAGQRAEQWRETFGNTITKYGEFEILATISIGLSSFPINGATPDALIDKADEAMYQAKKQGRNCVVVAD